jgi:hypothetical protein
LTPEPVTNTPEPIPNKRSVRKTVAISAAGLVIVLLVLCAAWMASRAVIANDALKTILPLTATLQKQIVAGNLKSADLTSAQISLQAGKASKATNGAMWKGLEWVPLLGPNLAAVSALTQSVESISTRVIEPVARIAQKVNVNSFQPVDGKIDLSALVKIQPEIAKVAAQLRKVDAAVKQIDTTNTFGAIAQAKTQLRAAVAKASNEVDSIDRIASLVPPMLGSDGPRNYLLLFQNPAELRALGGIPGAVAEIHTEGGKIEMTRQASTANFAGYPASVLPLTPVTESIYGDIVGQYLQNVTMTPHFAESAVLAQEMWKKETGITVDGVIAVDPVSLSYILKATGPIRLATGDELTSGNAVKLLLSEVYNRYSSPLDQDKFFASAAEAIFGVVSSGKIDPKAFINALATAGDEHRLLIWSARAAEQTVLAQTTLAGGLPESDTETRRFGVYLNDATGAKMDYYLSVNYGIGSAVCASDNRPNYSLTITLTNKAPLNAATALKPYVTGGRGFGVTPGNIRTNLAIYAPDGVQGLDAMRDGKTLSYNLDFDSKQQVALAQVEIEPGQTTVLRFNYLSEKPSAAKLEVVSTPTIVINPTASIAVLC